MGANSAFVLVKKTTKKQQQQQQKKNNKKKTAACFEMNGPKRDCFFAFLSLYEPEHSCCLFISLSQGRQSTMKCTESNYY